MLKGAVWTDAQTSGVFHMHELIIQPFLHLDNLDHQTV
jgi:hypothetical protein